MPKLGKDFSMEIQRLHLKPIRAIIRSKEVRNWTTLITYMKFISFLTPDMASKNDARYGIG